MKTLVLLDTGPLGVLTNPKAAPEMLNWLKSLVSRGVKVKVPEIADYELRRELLRADKFEGIQRLDELQQYIGYVPLTTHTMLEAARLWAQVRKQGLPTADNKALDGDVILAAQAKVLEHEGYEVVIATTNVRHLSRLVMAKEWRDILHF
jgi:predicted nucleic acid-binding protein